MVKFQFKRINQERPHQYRPSAPTIGSNAGATTRLGSNEGGTTLPEHVLAVAPGPTATSSGASGTIQPPDDSA
jgi:hypothetical protein